MKRRLLVALLWMIPSLIMAQTGNVLFSAAGGFYEDSFPLTLQCQEGYHIRYTTNGNTPDATSPLYEAPLTLDATMFSRSNIFTIVNCIPSTFYMANDVKRAIVVRAAAFDANDSCVSPVNTQSYFIRSLGCNTHGLPVVSIVTDSLSLFDYYTGIFVPGATYDPADSSHTGNFCQRGREWERLVNMEFYETNNIGINQLCGLRTHGGASRWFQQKGLRFYAREEYGKKRFNHRFFSSIPIASFKRLNLHPFRCSNWLQTGGQEQLAQTVAAKLDIDALAVRQVTVFINGEYWGIYTLEESPDERYLEDHYQVDLEQVSIFKYWNVPQEGDSDDWLTFYRWFKNADLSQPEDSAYAWQRIDVSNLTDYLLFETFSANLDWPQNNTMHWLAAAGEPARWIFYDGDGCFTRPYFDATNNALHQGGNSITFTKFIGNPYFTEQFIQRYHQLRQTHFSYESMSAILEQYRVTVENEIYDQSRRFHFPTTPIRWYQDMEKADAFLSARHDYYLNELYTYIGVDEISVPMTAPICSPNPSSGCFSLRLHSPADLTVPLEIYDLTGRKVFSSTLQLLEGENSIPVQTTLPAGFYLLKAGTTVEKIIIQ